VDYPMAHLALVSFLPSLPSQSKRALTKSDDFHNLSSSLQYDLLDDQSKVAMCF
jgi:hypothetical protein